MSLAVGEAGVSGISGNSAITSSSSSTGGGGGGAPSAAGLSRGRGRGVSIGKTRLDRILGGEGGLRMEGPGKTNRVGDMSLGGRLGVLTGVLVLGVEVEKLRTISS